MEYTFRQANDTDQRAILSIFNHYVETSYASYFESLVDESFLIQLKQMTSGYPFYVIETREKQVVGFCFIHRYHPAKTFSRVAELSYFILPSHTRKGLGTQLLSILVDKAVEMVKVNLANPSFESKRLALEALNIRVTLGKDSIIIDGTIPISHGAVVTTPSRPSSNNIPKRPLSSIQGKN